MIPLNITGSTGSTVSESASNARKVDKQWFVHDWHPGRVLSAVIGANCDRYCTHGVALHAQCQDCVDDYPYV